MRNIAVFIGNRADAGPLGPVVKAIEAHPGLRVSTLDLDGNDPALWFSVFRPDCVVLLGDRHELLIAAHAALLAQIPIAHIHGGETTRGSFDDKVRRAVSQLADIHFVAAQDFALNLYDMGIDSNAIHVVGPPGLDDLETDEVSEFGSGFFLVCLHPDTTADVPYNMEMAGALCEALDRFPDRKVVAIDCNRDPGGEAIWQAIITHGGRKSGQAPFILQSSMNRRLYLTALKHAAVCIGNSSSFVIEAPALGAPTVLVGDRQRGRPLAGTIRCAIETADAIEAAVRDSLSKWIDADTGRPAPLALPYGRGGASQKIAEILAIWHS